LTHHLQFAILFLHEESVNHHERKADAMMRDLIGQQLGNYRLVKLLGRGGFAEVYLGQHVRLSKQTAAIKVLHAHLSEEQVKGFEQEAQTIAALIHPHIVRILDFDVTNGLPFLVMDCCPNGTLRQRHVKGDHVPLPTVVTYVQQIADALQYAHENKIIHRDIKPENMLLGHRNILLLSDFGIAATAHSTSSMSTQIPVGTIPYMAPEQIQAQARPASDQYALGIVVYEWLCGTRPFEGSYTEIFAKHMMTPPPPLREKVPTLPPEVEQVVLTALAKDPKDRFATIQAFATALDLASQTKPLTPVPPQPTPVPPLPTPPPVSTVPALPVTPVQTQGEMNTPADAQPRWVYMAPEQIKRPPASMPRTPKHRPTLQLQLTRRKVLIGLATTGVVAAGGGAVWWILAPHIGTLLFTYKDSDYVRAVAWSPDGKRIASGSFPQSLDGEHIASGPGDVQVWDAVSGDHVYTKAGDVGAVAWSPDGKRIASGGGAVQVWDAMDGSHVYTFHGLSGWVDAMAWSPDGKCIASGSDSGVGVVGAVQVWDAVNGGNVYTYNGHSDMVLAVAWSPDGKRIASGSNDHTVQVWNAVNGKNVYMYKGHSGMVSAVAWSLDGKRIASGSYDKTVQVWEAS
jgi:serine/threonine protein kinase